ncbi:Cutinase, partial [Lachnellula suecica]
MRGPVFLFFTLLFSVSQASLFSCSKSEEGCLSSFLNASSVLETFLSDAKAVVVKNDILKNGNGTAAACPKMTVLFARGTSEPGNVGILTGPPFFTAMADYINGTNQLAIQGVDYPADLVGFLAGGSPIGGAVMAALINHTLTSCPTTPLVLSGYSQGAQVVHLATAALPSNTTSKIASVVLFGDPKNGTALQGVDSSKVLTVCHPSDDICKGGDDISVAHLNYSGNAMQAAMFVMGSAAGTLGITSQKMRTAGL